jgi:hypothetical protein
MLILPNEKYGYYLHYLDKAGNAWLSLHDPAKLRETAECADEWYASIGLFLPKDLAWIAVKEFIETGERSSEIKWIKPADLPEGGNC